MKIKKAIIDYATKLKSSNLSGTGGYIVYRIDESKAYLFDGDFGNAVEDEIKIFDYTTADTLQAKLLRSKKDTNVIMSVSPPKIMVVAKAKTDIPAVLDDMAQIVGVKARVCKDDDASILKTIKKATSVIVEDKGAIITARTLNEAFTCCLVLEKSALVFVSASVIGGCRKNGYIASKLMRIVYKLKYSKKNQELMLSEEK